jgi:hypothetical protein
MQVTNDIIILRINANQVRLIQCPFIKHNYFYDCQNFKTKFRTSAMNVNRERKEPELIELFSFLEIIHIHTKKLQYHVLRLYSAICNELCTLECVSCCSIRCVVYSGLRLYLTHCSGKRMRNDMRYKDNSLLNVKACSMIEVRRRFRVTCSIIHQGRRKNK